MNKLLGVVLAVVGGLALGGIALHRQEPVNSLWIVVASACVYLLGYRFYSAWIAAKVYLVDPTRATPAERLNNGRDFVPTQRWVAFGHHFAAIAGPGPLVGPTLAAQFGYLPGTLWIIVGSVLGGCVQDMTILMLSMRRDGKTLGQMARDELGPVGGFAALIGTLMIMIILIAVLGLVVVNAMKHSPWATSTVFATIPVAILVGFYMRSLRPGRVLEATAIGVVLIGLSVFGGGWVDQQSGLRAMFDYPGTTLAGFVIAYGWLAAIVPVWLLLAPRDYLSTFLKLGTVFLLAIAILLMHPQIKMPAITQFVDGTGPLFTGKVFPFVFITIACGAVSGFHALISSGTTPKLIANERDVRLIGYGSMALESFVAIMAMIAATLLDPGVYFAINVGSGIAGATPDLAVQTITGWGFPVTTDQMAKLAHDMGEATLFARTGGAPSLAVGMASIFGSTFGRGLLSVWYHFAIMFEAVFILTTIDAGTRVARYVLQELIGKVHKPFGNSASLPGNIIASLLVVLGWAYLIDTGSVSTIWPMFGTGNQLLATIALAVATTFLINMGKSKYAWITFVPMCFVGATTITAGVLSIKNIFLPLAAKPGQALTGYLNSILMVIFIVGVVLVLIEATRRWIAVMRGAPAPEEAFGPPITASGEIKMGCC
jgi:carbon starvation protein